MWNRIAADMVLVAHLSFILFIVLGGLLALRWRWMPWVHLPTVAYGALIEFVGWTCPLTPLERRLRVAAGQGGYQESFVEHYIVPIIYPSGYSFGLRMALGTAVIVINVAIYAWLIVRSRGE
ncbi:MAG: DUF2784 domain-containing protein [Myxococcota bacterium]